jgi:hypothetical protein
MAVLGVVLALIWRNVVPKLSFASLSPQITNSTGSPEVAQQFEILKKAITDLQDSHQQSAAKIAALQAAQDHMQQELSSRSAVKWYSDTKMLMYQTRRCNSRNPLLRPNHRNRNQNRKMRP